MGLDASVMCNCYRDGKATACPFPEDFYVDEDGFPAVRIADFDDSEKSDEFDEWLATCCEHPNMDYRSVFIANWRGYQSFRDALGQFGWDHFPILYAELPAGNEGVTSAKAASAALHELSFFKARGDGIPKIFLVNTETGGIIGASMLEQNNPFGLDARTGLTIGFDEDGFFIRDAWELNRELFRAMRFEQRIVEADGLDKPQQYEYIDMEHDRHYVCSTPIRVFERADLGQLKQVYPSKMHVEKRAVDAAYFDYILQPLIAIFEAAVETGNPVRWS